MLGSDVLEVALGLALLYAGLSLFVASFAELGGRALAVVAAGRPLAWYRRRSQLIVFALAAVLVAALNADTLLVVRALSGGAAAGGAPAALPVRAADSTTGATFGLIAARTSAGTASMADASVQAREGVFISYSHRDSVWLERLRVALEPFERAQAMTVWDDRAIVPGEQWEQAILAAIERSRVAVLLVSPDLLASDYVLDVELPAIMAQRAAGLTVLWVALRHSAYGVTSLSELQAVNQPAAPVATLSGPDQDRVFVEIASAIAAAARGEAFAAPARIASGRTLVVAGGAGVPLGWDNAFEELSLTAAQVAIKAAGLALTAAVVTVLAPLWFAVVGVALTRRRGQAALG